MRRFQSVAVFYEYDYSYGRGICNQKGSKYDSKTNMVKYSSFILYFDTGTSDDKQKNQWINRIRNTSLCRWLLVRTNF